MRMMVAVFGGVMLGVPACAGTDDGGEPARNAESQVPEELRMSCRRFLGVVDTLSVDCEPGQLMQRGVLLGDGRMPPDEAPLSNDEEQISFCVSAEVREGYECWQKYAADNDCFADSIFTCGPDRTWGGSFSCSEAVSDTPCPE